MLKNQTIEKLKHKKIFDEWIGNASLLEERAIIAALAHPPVLKERDNVIFCLGITEAILDVAELPEEGFELMTNWAKKDDSDIKKIIKSNLGKPD